MNENMKKCLERQTARARALGCTVQTLAGIVRFLREYPGRYDGRLSVMVYVRRWDINAVEQKRTSDSDAKRARADVVFRRGWLADLRAQARRAAHPAVGSLEAITRAADSAADRRRTLAELQRRAEVAGVRLTHKLATLPGVLIPVKEDIARKAGCKIDMSGKDAQIIETRGSSHLKSAPPVVEWNKRSQPRTTSRAVRDNYVRSFALIQADKRRLDYALHTREVRVELPESLAWGVDGNGLRAYMTESTRDDYHPGASDLLAGAVQIASKLTANREKRLVLEAQEAVTRAEAEGVWVCLEDSLRAGNCRQASEAWALRHGLDPEKHYPATKIFDMIGTDDPGRARLAITAAVLRHKKELVSGVCAVG